MLKPSLQLRIGQQLTMTPQLQQAIRLLQLPVMELQTQLQEALESNVMLEISEDSGETAAQPADTAEQPAQAEAAPDDSNVVAGEEVWPESTMGSVSGERNYSSGDGRQTQDFADESGDSLQEHLLWQLEMESMPPRDFVIGQTLIDAINEDGYLTDDLSSIQEILLPDISASTDDIFAVLQRIQRFDPVGVGARSLSECLSLQLAQLEPDTPSLAQAMELVESGLELLGEQRYDVLQKRLAVSDEEFDHALLLVRSLHPRPGQAVSRSTAQYVVPDVFVRKQDGQWIVDVNGGVTPSIKVNQSYANLIARNGDHSVLRTQLQEARWLVRSLEIRKETLLKVATCIVSRQQEFLDHGDEAMRPMVLRDVAEALEMHESTISRVTTNKFMHTPRGVFEFRYFFSSHVGGDDGSETSSIAIRAMIRKLIGKENTAKPLSDNKISQMLNKSGINVARRTVAKYREAIGIPSSSERKRLASR